MGERETSDETLMPKKLQNETVWVVYVVEAEAPISPYVKPQQV